MTSMTGFGHLESRTEKAHLTIEMRSYNNRYLDVYLNLPSNLSALEPRMREYISSRVERGKIEVYLGLTEEEKDLSVSVDPAAVTAYVTALKELSRAAGIREKVRLSHLIGMEGLFKAESRRDPEEFWLLILPLLEQVFAEFQKTRQVEGRKTEEDIRRLAAGIRDQVAVVEGQIPKIEEKITTSLKERFHQLLGEGVDESRVLAETAVLLVKFDINEELQRMKAHLESLFTALGTAGGQGKKLDFVCQELGREINTIGSKSMLLEVDQAVISVKDSLEKIREQLRNVE